MFYYNSLKIKKIIKKIILLIIAFIIISMLVFAIDALNFSNRNVEQGIVEAQNLESSEQNIKDLYELNRESIKVINNATKSVVGISKLKDTGSSIFQSDGAQKIGIGSGIIVSENGYILTNEHVSGSKGGSCYITIEDGKQYKGSVVWSDSNLDLSIVKVNMKFIDTCILGDSSNINVGETVYAIGNPVGFEFQRTVTSGIISAFDRTIVFKEGDIDVYLSNLIQTDAVINPGNSGGPLVNVRGEVIGINTVKITSADGIGFAVPINVIKPIINRFETEGNFDEPEIGIFAYDKNVIPYLSTGISFENGIYVAQISLDSPAFKSGLQIGDIITKIDGIELEKMCDLREYIYKKNVGDRVKLSILRSRKNIEIEVDLSKKT